MDRATALQELLGTRVSAWTSANGIYSGRLIEIIPGEPSRGRVRIEGVIECGVHYELGRVIIGRGREVGESIEVDAANIEPAENAGLADYSSALLARADEFDSTYKLYLEGAYGDPDDSEVKQLFGWHDIAAMAYRQVALVRAAMNPIAGILSTPDGVQRVRSAMAQLVAEGAVQTWRKTAVPPDYDWETVVRARIKDDIVHLNSTEFRDTLLDRLGVCGEDAVVGEQRVVPS